MVQRFKSRARYSRPRKTTNQYENSEKVGKGDIWYQGSLGQS
jgi:hypothetical protein